MSKTTMYPQIAIEMVKHGESQKDLAKILNLTISSVSLKLSGKVRWFEDEVRILCEHYKKDYLELFRKGE